MQYVHEKQRKKERKMLILVNYAQCGNMECILFLIHELINGDANKKKFQNNKKYPFFVQNGMKIKK
jgi:hypothetical protein